jgi:hypothetical protein
MKGQHKSSVTDYPVRLQFCYSALLLTKCLLPCCEILRKHGMDKGYSSPTLRTKTYSAHKDYGVSPSGRAASGSAACSVRSSVCTT